MQYSNSCFKWLNEVKPSLFSYKSVHLYHGSFTLKFGESFLFSRPINYWHFHLIELNATLICILMFFCTFGEHVLLYCLITVSMIFNLKKPIIIRYQSEIVNLYPLFRYCLRYLFVIYHLIENAHVGASKYFLFWEVSLALAIYPVKTAFCLPQRDWILCFFFRNL